MECARRGSPQSVVAHMQQLAGSFAAKATAGLDHVRGVRTCSNCLTLLARIMIWLSRASRRRRPTSSRRSNGACGRCHGRGILKGQNVG